MRTRYFVRKDNDEAPLYVFRILPTVDVEVYDVNVHAWKPRPLEPLYRWALIEPEWGVDEMPGDEVAPPAGGATPRGVQDRHDVEADSA